ncbi:MAG: 2-hydroxyacid dehydrogenase [Rhodobacteraceae bacterium]|nr:2-hydroxyacid dehydrogenase [Paracoccaceae bacterium]
MSKPEIILVEPMMPAIEARLDAAYTVHRLFEPGGRDTALAARPKIRAVVTGGGSGIGSDWIEAMPDLGIVAINGVGTDRVNLALARSRGVDVTTTPGTLTEDVADMGMALMLAVLRRIVEGDGFVRQGRWAAREPFPLGGSLKGRRLGILGLGQIGRALARRAEVFGMSVRYWDRAPIPGNAWAFHEDPHALAADSDVLAVCVAATPETRGMVDAGLLASLGRTGVVVNISRGSVVDEPALIDALRSGAIAAAGLDVFASEPEIDPAFLSLANTVITPHQASATVETRIAMGEAVLANLSAHFAGARPPAVVN